VINAQEKIIGIAFELSDQWRFADIFNDLVAHKGPKLLWRNPNGATPTNNSR
jgi:hypothetical protein